MSDDDFEDEDLAGLAIQELREFVDSVKQHVTDEHSFKDKLDAWDYIILDLESKIVKGSSEALAIGAISECERSEHWGFIPRPLV